MFDRKVTEDEALDIQAYLMKKWFNTRMEGYAEPNQPYTVYSAGSGRDGSCLEIRGAVPTQVLHAFGNRRITLTAPETVVRFPDIQGSLQLKDATVASSTSTLKDVSVCPGYVGGVYADEGRTVMLAGTFTCTGGTFRKSGPGTVAVPNMSLSSGSALLFEINAAYVPGSLSVGTLTSAGDVTCNVSFDSASAQNPVGRYRLMSGIASGQVADWTFVTTGFDTARYAPTFMFCDNSLVLSVSENGTILTFR